MTTWPDIKGWSLDVDRAFLYERIIALQADKVVELGVYAGRMTFALAEALRHTGGVVHCVDPWEEMPNGPEIAREFLNTVTKYQLEDRVRIHAQSSHDFALRNVPAHVCLTWIDGMHTFEAVRQDLEDWYERSRVVYGHDWHLEGVRTAATEYARSAGLVARKIEGTDNIWTVSRAPDF